MSMNTTDTELHAFVDGQLAGEERACVLEETTNSAPLAARLEELQNLKQLVQLAFRDVDCPAARSARRQPDEQHPDTATVVGTDLTTRR
jgi:anti-sigma factor RsiW